MDWAALKAADAALGDLPPDQAAEALNAQTETVATDVATSDARAILLPTGEYGGLILLSEQRQFSDAMPRNLVIAAITAVKTFESGRLVLGSDDAAWGGVANMLGAFVQAGVVTPASRDAIMAMRYQPRPKWPPLDAGMIQTARAQP